MWHTSRQNVYWSFRVTLAVFYLYALTVSARAGEKIIDEEAISKWEAYERFSRSLQGSARRTHFEDSGKVQRFRAVYKQNRDCVLDCIADEEKSTERCQLANPRYAAILKWSKTDPGKTILERFTEDSSDASSKFSTSIFTSVIFLISPYFCVGRTPLRQFVSDTRYKIQKMSRVSEKGSELVRIDFTHSLDDPKLNLTGQVQGSIFLDPARCWCIRRFQGSTKTRDTKSGTMGGLEFETEYETVDHPARFPLIKKSTTRETFYNRRTKKKEPFRREIEYEWKVDDNVPDAEFTLTAFGLPEPGGEPPVKKPFPLYVWVLIAGGTCGALALGFWYVARRIRAKPAVQ